MYAMLSRTFLLILQMNIIFTEHYSYAGTRFRGICYKRCFKHIHVSFVIYNSYKSVSLGMQHSNVQVWFHVCSSTLDTA